MNKANECTCPSGDGSLVHPCPAHPAVEQVGGDERAAFEAAYQTEHAGFMGPLKLERREDGEYKSEHVGSAWRMWQARAALAQPSPAQTQPSPAPTLRAAIDVANDRFEVPVAKWGTDLVGEEERPEVVAYFDRNYPSTGDAFIWSNYEGSPYEPVMTVAQHDRIVGALRAKADQLREALEWRKENQAGQRELLRTVTAERDAALARVAEFEAQSQHSAGYAEARQCVNCRHIGINDAADYAACHDYRWTGPEPDEDKCPGCAGENCMAAACPECGGRYELVAEANIATPVAQGGQVPQAWLDVQAERRRQITAEGWTPEHDDLYCAAELPRAAAAYILNGANDEAPAIWPFVAKWWKPRDARSNYVRASALILAEIERLDRAAATQGGPRDA